MGLSLHRIIVRSSVRTRIIVLAAIPVLGFLVNGIAYTIGEHEVAIAFHKADSASDLAEVSREFRANLVQMRARERGLRDELGDDEIAERDFGILGRAGDDEAECAFP